MWDFDHPPRQEELVQRYALSNMMPAQCAERLALPAEDADAADIGLVPIAAYAETRELVILPGCAIASKGAIRSLLLVYRKVAGIEAIRTVAADTSSRATFAYVQILFQRYWRLPVSYAPHAPNLDRMLEACDAAVLIGDPALLALEDREARELRTGEDLIYLDLGAVWHEFAGLPWISAFWAARQSALVSTEQCTQVCQDFLLSRDHGLAHREELVIEWARKIALPEETIRAYLHENIHYVLDDDCITGLETFFRLAYECDVLPKAPPLRFLAL